MNSAQIRPTARAARAGAALLWLAMLAALLPRPLPALELCSRESRDLMREAGIRADKIATLCKLAERSTARLAISLRRRENELGYCLITLALHNNTTQYLNRLSLTSANGRFDIFRFHNIPPGTTGYASARSRILLACDELREIGLAFRWPAVVRIGDRALEGRGLDHYKPVLLDKVMRWGN